MNGNKLPLEDITIYDSVDNKSGLVIGEKDGKCRSSDQRKTEGTE